MSTGRVWHHDRFRKPRHVNPHTLTHDATPPLTFIGELLVRCGRENSELHCGVRRGKRIRRVDVENHHCSHSVEPRAWKLEFSFCNLHLRWHQDGRRVQNLRQRLRAVQIVQWPSCAQLRSEEHTSELQSL